MIFQCFGEMLELDLDGYVMCCFLFLDTYQRLKQLRIWQDIIWTSFILWRFPMLRRVPLLTLFIIRLRWLLLSTIVIPCLMLLIIPLWHIPLISTLITVEVVGIFGCLFIWCAIILILCIQLFVQYNWTCLIEEWEHSSILPVIPKLFH